MEHRSCGNEPSSVGFSGVNYANDLKTGRSVSGFIFCFANGPMCRTTETDYVAGATIAKEGTWLRELKTDIGHHCISSI